VHLTNADDIALRRTALQLAFNWGGDTGIKKPIALALIMGSSAA
jgi:hypothetical protein